MKTICITAMDDGTFSVELEPAEMPGMTDGAEMPEGSAMDMTEDRKEGESGQVFRSVDEALSAARKLLVSGGKPMMDGEAEFAAGFASARGQSGGY